jgi:hypothetical protein
MVPVERRLTGHRMISAGSVSRRGWIAFLAVFIMPEGTAFYWNRTDESRIKIPKGRCIIRMETKIMTWVYRLMLIK